MKTFIQNFKKYRFLLEELTKKDVKLKYRNSALGFVWTLLEPLLTMIVLTIVFGTLLHKRTPHFAVYILSGRLLYSYFSTGTKQALKSIRRNGGMIRKVYVPKYMYPLAASLSSYITFALSLIVLVIVAAVQGIRPTRYLIGAIVPLATLFLMVTAIGFLLSTLDVFFRDLEYIWNVATMLIMYMSAIFYEADTLLESQYGFLIRYNPLYAVIANFRNAVVYGRPLEGFYLWYPVAVSLVILVVGLLFFYKKQDSFVLYL
ncbi:MAG: ABC transporter permease [Lachnospiraceae bacterium]|nr:ABC transporter permease [Lachnospiraceae bacterium]